MDKILQPGKLAIDPNSPSATKEWKHWKRIFTSYVNKYITLTTSDDIEGDKLSALVSCATPEVFEYFDHCQTFSEAETILEQLFVKQPNDIFARHVLRMAKQKPNQSLEDFRCTLVKLAKDCEFNDVSALQYKDDMMRDSFISGILSGDIRQRLLEHKTLTLKQAFDQAVTLSNAKRDNRLFGSNQTGDVVSELVNAVEESGINEVSTSAAMTPQSVCVHCGSNKPHDFKKCKAKSQTCFKCGSKGHYGRACHLQKKISSFRKGKEKLAVVKEDAFVVCVTKPLTNDVEKLNQAIVNAEVHGSVFKTLVDTGSSKSFVNKEVAKNFKVERNPIPFNVGMAQGSKTCQITDFCEVDISLMDNKYHRVKLYVMKNMCNDIILGRDFLQEHQRVVFEFKGKLPDLTVSKKEICAVSKAKISTPSLFENLKPGWKPIATKSRRFNEIDKAFISETVAEWRKAGTIRPSNSPWRAQCVIVRNHGDKERLAIDYSQTINLFTEKDGYPIPLIEDIVNDLARFQYFASYDLKRAYHQIPIAESDKPFTAFEAEGKLFEFNVMPFGVTNGGPVFQRIMAYIIEEDKLKNTLVYFDYVIIGAASMTELEVHSARFLKSMAKRRMTMNESKTIYGVEELNILGYRVGKQQIRPDPDRLKPLLDLPPPHSSKALQRTLGLFAYYSKWIPRFSDRIGRLKSATNFPLHKHEVLDFEEIKKSIAAATLRSLDESLPFTVECDASEIAVSATLNQNGRPVAFMSRSLQGSEIAYPAVEKEATAIIEAVRKWSHFLVRQPFVIVTDQRSVAFMLDSRKRTKIKNNKILCWRLELASFAYSISYRPGKSNVGPDTLTRAFCASVPISTDPLEMLHKELCCPGITRLWHFVRLKNLPYSLDDVKACIRSCKTCAEIKPQFFTPKGNRLIKATQPMERLNIDFKGPLPTGTKNAYFLCVVDEFSRYPFCFPCSDVSATTVIGCLEKLFSLFGTCNFIHSDRGSSLMSRKLKDYLLQKGVACSRTTPYHPQGNAQCERYNGIIWKAVRCALKTRQLPIEKWEIVLSEALNSIRSLLCTSTNQTPHSRFFSFTRRSCHGRSLPNWLCKQGPVMLRKFVRSGKNDDVVRKVDLIEANPMYARIRYPDGKESNVSLRDLARCPVDDEEGLESPFNENQGKPDIVDNEEARTEPNAIYPRASESNNEQQSPGNATNDDVRRETNEENEEPNCDTELLVHNRSSPRVVTPRISSRCNKGNPAQRFGEWVK